MTFATKYLYIALAAAISLCLITGYLLKEAYIKEGALRAELQQLSDILVEKIVEEDREIKAEKKRRNVYKTIEARGENNRTNIKKEEAKNEVLRTVIPPSALTGLQSYDNKQ